MAVWLLAVWLLSITVGASQDYNDDAWRGFSTSCTFENPENASISCHGVRIVRRIVQELLENSKKEPNIEIIKGVNLVEAKSDESTRRARLLKGFGLAAPLLQFLEGRELRIKLPNLLPQNLNAVFEDSLPKNEGRSGGGGGGGGGYKGGGGGGGKRGKKGGGGMVMMMGLMMGKMMATLGFGALAMIAMKALLVSSLALMLSLIIGVKKLASQNNDHGGHHVVYAQEIGHHHHRKRSSAQEEPIDLPYRGYTPLYDDLRVS